MTDVVFWGFIALMVGWHTPAPVWATWVWNLVKDKASGMATGKR